MQFQKLTAEIDLAALGLSADDFENISFEDMLLSPVYHAVVFHLFPIKVKYEPPKNDCVESWPFA